MIVATSTTTANPASERHLIEQTLDTHPCLLYLHKVGEKKFTGI